MVDVVYRYAANQITVYPSTNAVDGGQFNKEEFISQLAKHATKVNHVIRELGDENEYFTLSGTNSLSFTQGIYISVGGLCCIDGYYILFQTKDDPKEDSISWNNWTGTSGYFGLMIQKDEAGHLQADTKDDVAGGWVCNAVVAFKADTLSDLEDIDERNYLLLGGFTSKTPSGVFNDNKKYICYNVNNIEFNFSDELELHRIVLQDTPQAKVVIDDDPKDSNETIGMTISYTPQGGGKKSARYGYDELSLTTGNGGTGCSLSPTTLNLTSASGKSVNLNTTNLCRGFSDSYEVKTGDPVVLKRIVPNGNPALLPYKINNTIPNGGVIGVYNKSSKVVIEGVETIPITFNERAASGSLLYADYDDSTETSSIKVLDLDNLPTGHYSRYDCVGYLTEDVDVEGVYTKSGLTLNDLGLYSLKTIDSQKHTKIVFGKDYNGNIVTRSVVDDDGDFERGTDYDLSQVFDYDTEFSGYKLDDNIVRQTGMSNAVMSSIKSVLYLTDEQKKSKKTTQEGLWAVGVNKKGSVAHYAYYSDPAMEIHEDQGLTIIATKLGITIDEEYIELMDDDPTLSTFFAFFTFLQVGMPVSDKLSDLPFTGSTCEASLSYDSDSETYSITIPLTEGITKNVQVYVSPQVLFIPQV